MSTKVVLVKSALQWAFGKDGVNLSVYVILYVLIYYWDRLVFRGLPEPLLYIFVGVIVNLDNNALKAMVKKFADKYDFIKRMNFYMRNGKSFNEAKELATDPDDGTVINSYPVNN